ncbi:MAG: LPP20 family lipoprotein [Gemmatimonadetes bacterium]|nr:LPP20 family lipoprotein [Gemmatimonadota bacterium]
MRAVTMLALMLSLSGCFWRHKVDDGSNPALTKTLKAMPSWYTRPPKSDSSHVYAPATATSQELQLALNKAQAEARAGIAAQLEVKYAGITNRLASESGVGRDATLVSEFQQSYRAVIGQVLLGSAPKEQQVGVEEGVYRVFVLMELPVGAASRRLLDQLKLQDQVYTQLKGTSAFKELNDEVERYEALKGAHRP